jgi:hypothetical protein
MATEDGRCAGTSRALSPPVQRADFVRHWPNGKEDRPIHCRFRVAWPSIAGPVHSENKFLHCQRANFIPAKIPLGTKASKMAVNQYWLRHWE